MLRKLLLVRDFFPLRLLVAHIKYNFFGLTFWAFLFAVVADVVGIDFGVPYLFFSPEYLGRVSIWGFMLLGFSIGAITMAFNTYSYSKLGPRFPFLLVVSTPFFRFCINNSLLPITYISCYLYKMSIFQSVEEFATSGQIIQYNLAYLLGFFGFIFLSILYFFPIRKNRDHNDDYDEETDGLIASLTNKGEKWYNYFKNEPKRPVFYIGKRFRIYRSRSIAHLELDVIDSIYASNRINAFIFEFMTVMIFLGLGFMQNFKYFEVPAAVSMVTLLTILFMLISALRNWFHRWSLPVIVAVIVSMTYISSISPFFRYTSYALGLDYSFEGRAEYTVAAIRNCGTDKKVEQDSRKEMEMMLRNWKKKQVRRKPKLIILNTSGGGSRSALWTFIVLSNCDSVTNNKISLQLQFITGASGGMIGAAYYRELILRRNLGLIKTNNNQHFIENLGKDLLNRLSFSASTSDLLMRYKQFKYNNHYYTQERGVAFEQQLHENLENYLEHPLEYYKSFELKSQAPLMIFSPTIINDGRRLLISSQNLSFLVNKRVGYTAYENIDYQSFFKDHKPAEIRFSSVLRANASFPFIMPMMTLPTKPEIQLMDAGIRDNYGGKLTVDYLFANAEWIQKNTSGVVIIETRDTKRILDDESYNDITLFDKISMPFGNILVNFPRTQDFDQEQLMKLVQRSFDFPVDVVSFNLRERENDRISLSWRLTKLEKKRVAKAFFSKENTSALQKLEVLLR